MAALDEEAYEVVRSFLLRSHELSPAARDHMAVRLANARGHPHATTCRAQFLHPQAFLDCVAAAWQRAHRVIPPALTTRRRSAPTPTGLRPKRPTPRRHLPRTAHRVRPRRPRTRPRRQPVT